MYTKEDAKAEWERTRKQWCDAFGEDPGMIRQTTYAVFEIMLRGEWLPLTFDLTELGDGTLIERVKAHLQDVIDADALVAKIEHRLEERGIIEIVNSAASKTR